MIILFVTDIHGRREGFDRLPAAEVALLGGDLTQFGSAADVRQVVGLAQARFGDVLAVVGNCDPPAGDAVLAELGVGLRAQPTVHAGVAFSGLSGSNTTPFRTPYEWTDATMATRLTQVAAGPPASTPWVLVSHAPPLGSGAGRLPGGQDAGSSAVAQWIRRQRPALVLCGHIHEAVGVFALDGIPVINPGALRTGHYALLDLAPDGTLRRADLGQIDARA
jgi:uncharacterized protein